MNDDYFSSRKSYFLLTTVLVLLLLSCGGNSKNDSSSDFVSNDTLRYDIYIGTRLAGEQLSWREKDGSYKYYYEFNDRGRGPKLEETIKTNTEGAIISHSVTGLNYLKESVDENFNVLDTHANWKSDSEKGEAPFLKNPFYISVNHTYASRELLLKRLLKSPDSSTVLLPGGNASVASITPFKVGDSLDLRLIGISGLGFLPEFIWFTKNNTFFGLLPGRSFVLPKGHENLFPLLDSVQKAVSNEYLSNIAKELYTTPKKGIAITNVTLFDSKSKSNRKDMTVLVKGNSILSVSPSSKMKVPDGFDVIEGEGKTLLPGLFDMHIHLGDEDGVMNLAAGVTSVRDMGNSKDLVSLEKKYNENTLIGPRIPIKSKLMDGAGKFAGRTNMIMENLEQGLAYVQETKDAGYDQVKLYSSVKPEWVKPLVEKAHSLGLKVSGHIPAYMLASQAVLDGFDGLTHINMLFLNFMSDTIATQTPLRLSMPAEHADEVDLNSKEFYDFVALLKKKDIVVDPTVSVFEKIYTSKKGEVSPTLAAVIDRLPIGEQRKAKSGGLPRPKEKDQQYYDAYLKMLAMTKKLHDAGITLVAGTDAMAGVILHRELENYVKAGISTADVIQMATLGAAEVSETSEKLGSIEAGKLADMILVNGNPLEDISDIRKVDLTIKNGNLYDPVELYKVVGVKPYK